MHRTGKFFFRNSQIDKQSSGYEQIVIDIHFMANADFLVCTFSSNICRLVYELMQSKTNLPADFSKRVKSIDFPYFLNSDMRALGVAIMPNSIENDEKKYKAPNPCNSKNRGGLLRFEIGDIIQTFATYGPDYDGYQNNGCMYGVKKQTQEHGYFDSYKVIRFFKYLV